MIENDWIDSSEIEVYDVNKNQIQTEQENEFGEVLSLTEYIPEISAPTGTDFVIAEYNKVDAITIDKKQQQIAKSFVNKITKFVLEFNDVQLTEQHKKYIEDVGKLQLTHLSDLLTLIEINKITIANIVARINATQAEDYALIASYNSLLNQHLKLIKETKNYYTAIPNVIKKMRADILSNQELEAPTDMNNEVVTEEFGERQFNNGKQLLKSILEKQRKENEINQSK